MSSLLVQGKWKGSSSWNTILDPLNGEPFIKVAEVDKTGIQVCIIIMSSLIALFSKKIFPVIECAENVLAELRSLCFIMLSFPCPSLTNSIILTLKCLLLSAYLNQFLHPQLWIDYAAICGELVQSVPNIRYEEWTKSWWLEFGDTPPKFCDGGCCRKGHSDKAQQSKTTEAKKKKIQRKSCYGHSEIALNQWIYFLFNLWLLERIITKIHRAPRF